MTLLPTMTDLSQPSKPSPRGTILPSLNCWSRNGLFCGISFLLATMGRAAAPELADAPYVPGAAVIKGTVAGLSDPFEEVIVLAMRDFADWREVGVAREILKGMEPDVPAGVRDQAIRYFIPLGPLARPFLPELVKQIADPDPHLRAQVLSVVFATGASSDFLPLIIPRLEDPRGEVRSLAALCVGQAGKAARLEKGALLKALGRAGNAEFTASILDALTQVGGISLEEAGPVARYLAASDEEVRISAYAAVVHALTEASDSGQAGAKEFKTLKEQVMSAVDAAPLAVQHAMIERAFAEQPDCRVWIDRLERRIRIGKAPANAAALKAVGLAGERALPLLPLILAQLKSNDSDVRAGALTALREIGPEAVRPNLDRIARALLDRSETVRSQALLALPLAGDALEHFPFRVRDVYGKAPPGVRATLLEALAVIVQFVGVTEDSLTQGREALHSPNANLRVAMAFVAGKFGSKNGARLLPDLLALLQDKDTAVCGAAIVALRSFASDAAAKQEIRVALHPILQNPDAGLRWAALDTIHELDPGQDAALVGEIAGMLEDDDRSVRDAAVRTLGAAGPAAVPHLVQIVRFFTDDPAFHPYAAAQTVRQLGPLDIPQLTSLLYPLYIYSDLLPMARLTVHAASGGDRDGQILIHLLGKSRETAATVLKTGENAYALDVLAEAIKAPLLHPVLKKEIESRMEEVRALKGK